MRFSVLFAISAIILSSCGSEPDPEAQELERLIQIRETLSECELHAGGHDSVAAVAELFDELQDTVRNEGVGALTRDQEIMLRALEEETRINGFTHTPVHSVGAFTPGDTTVDQFVRTTGIREFLRYTLLVNEIVGFERIFEMVPDTGFHLFFECDARASDLLNTLCDDGDGEACRRLEQAATRDLDRIAGACELTPYLLFCDMEDRPPLDLPPPDDTE